MGTCLSRQTKKITVIMLGLDNAGKTTTAKSLVGESSEAITPTLGFSSFQLKQQRFVVTIYDLGGGNSIRGIWKNYFAEAFGFIFVIDASASSRLQECQEVLHTLLKNPNVSGKPFLILANKQDVEGAMDEIEICGLLAIEAVVNKVKSRTRVESCSAIKTNLKKPDKHIQAGFHWLLTIIDAYYINLKEKVEQDVEMQKTKEAREKQEREERVRRLREERETYQPDIEATPELQQVNGNPFKPITNVVKELENQKKFNAVIDKTDILSAKVNQNESVIETERLEVASISTKPPHSTHPVPSNNVEYNFTSNSPKCAFELIKNAPLDIREKHSLSSPPHFLCDSNIITPPGSVEVPDEHLPKQSPISRQSTLGGGDDDEYDDSDIAAICNDTSTPSHFNKNSSKGSLELEKTAKTKKKTFSRNNKTAPMPDVEKPIPQRGELPPLILKSGNIIPWMKLTTVQPAVHTDSQVDSLQLNSDTKMKWDLIEELKVNERL